MTKINYTWYNISNTDNTSTSGSVATLTTADRALIDANKVVDVNIDNTTNTLIIKYLNSDTPDKVINLNTSNVTNDRIKVKESFTVSNDTTTSFTLSEIPIDTDMIFVFINGLLQDSPKDYTITDKTLNIINGLSTNDYIVVKYYKNTTNTTTDNTNNTN